MHTKQMAEEDDDEDRKRQRDEILEALDKKRRNFAVTTPQAPLPYFAQIILDIITNPAKAAETIVRKLNHYDIYGLELVLKNTEHFRLFFKTHNIWDLYRKRYTKFYRYPVSFPLPEKYSARWRYFTEFIIDKLLGSPEGKSINFRNQTTEKIITVTSRDIYVGTYAKERIINVTYATEQPLSTFLPFDIDIRPDKLWSISIAIDKTEIGQVIYNLFKTGYLALLTEDWPRETEYAIGLCLTCNRKATLCETGDETRVFCGETCQGKYYK